MFTLSFSTANSAFDGDDKPVEIARILREIADEIQQYGEPKYEQSILDVNGNTIGQYRLQSARRGRPA